MKSKAFILYFSSLARLSVVAVLVCALFGCEVPEEYVTDEAPPPKASRSTESAPPPAEAAPSSDSVQPGPTLSLHQAVAEADITQILWHSQLGTDLNAWNHEGHAPVHVAVLRNQPESLNILIQLRADVNRLDAGGSTALHLAARADNYEIARILLEGKADNTIKDQRGHIPRQVASRMGHGDLARFIGPELARPPEAEESYPPELQLSEEPSEDQDMPEEEPVLDVAEESDPAAYVENETEEIEESEEEMPGDYRIWTSASREQVEAEFQEIKMDIVYLRAKNGRILRIPINQLSGEDQIVARQMAQAQSLAKVMTPQVHGLSVGLRLARQSGWETLEDVKYLENEQSRADYIYVEYRGKKMWFRPYFVEAGETSWSEGEARQLMRQMQYWRLSGEDIIEVGKAATDEAGQYLQSNSFRIITNWEQANRPNEPTAYYGILWTKDGDYDEWLVARGLASLTGIELEGSLAREKRALLEKAEKAARDANLGIWAFHGLRR
jgi:hypothetical protein